MHIENMKKVRDFIAASPEHAVPSDDPLNIKNIEFDMSDFIQTRNEYGYYQIPGDECHCQTAACIAGFAKILHDLENSIDVNLIYVQIPTTAKNYLGLTDQEALTLFCAQGAPNLKKSLYSITKEEALAVLDIAIETGKIDWQKAIDQCKRKV